MKHQNITYCLISSLLLAAGASLQANGKSFISTYDEANSGAWQGIDYDGDPWVFNVSRPYFVTAGLQNRHLSLWASHGRYYYADRDVWKWQRPNLFCTNEDLFTQTIVVPYLIPMLQNAGAIVFTPRERDWQTNEIVIDNDDAVFSILEKPFAVHSFSLMSNQISTAHPKGNALSFATSSSFAAVSFQ